MNIFKYAVITVAATTLLIPGIVVPVIVKAATVPSSVHAASATFPLRIGEVGPIAADNPRQEPFACVAKWVDGYKHQQPAIDNHAGVGYPVLGKHGNVVGYSENCGLPMQVSYYYRSPADGAHASLRKYDFDHPPAQVKRITVNGKRVPFIVRFEQGTINRFIYTISVLSPRPAGTPRRGARDAPDLSEWNGDLVFYFNGAVGIGHSQGAVTYATREVSYPGEQRAALALLKRGYAVVNSTGTTTATTYNLVLTGQTARMVKAQFVAAYGRPRYTFGLGGSGGSIQQFIYAQNDPSLLDALIPTHVYPDMITQVDPVGDCELLEYYFDVVNAKVDGTGKVDPKWTSWSNRQKVIGFHGIDGFHSHKVIDSTAGPGSDACIEAWRGAIPQFFNPWDARDKALTVLAPAIRKLTPLSFFDDLVSIFGRIPHTVLARSTYDNVGVQYGLNALKRGQITLREFLELNAHVGGWKPRQDDVEPGYPYEGGKGPGGKNIDPWSSRNGTAAGHAHAGEVAPRTRGSVQAMRAAYRAGLVFRGDIKQPVIIIEPYLEPALNMHASREPFAVRQRLIEGRGDAKNLVVWMLGSQDKRVMLPFVLKALHVETQWLERGHRPGTVLNACYDANGHLIAKGNHVFKGEVSPDGYHITARDKGAGACTRAYPIYGDPRVEAGANISEHIFKCSLQSVPVAFHDGVYAGVTFSASQKARLRRIFPAGVCDYHRPGQGLPVDMAPLVARPANDP